VLGLHARSAEACTCAGPNPVCSSYWQHEAVFVGQVISIESVPGEIALSNNQTFPITLRRVHLRVTEAFSGVTTAEVDVETGAGGGDCGYAFQVGSTYVVYAYGKSGKLGTGICSPTKPLSAAGADLAYLRSLKEPAPTRARLYGTVRAWDDNENDPQGPSPAHLPYAGAQITATGAAGQFEATSGQSGTFEILAPAGRYDFTVRVPDGKYALPGWPNVELKDVRGCAELPVVVHSDGRVAGRVRDARGQPIDGLTVELVADNHLNDRFLNLRHVARTATSGAFEISQVPPGRYVIGFNTRPGLPYPRTIFGSEDASASPRVITLAAGERVTLGDLVLPASLSIRTVTGVVRDTSGDAIAGAKVYLKANSTGVDLVGQAATTGADGRFSLAVIEGYSYFTMAEVVGQPGDAVRIKSSAILPVPPSGTIALTIR